MPSCFAHQREMTTQSIKTESQPHLHFNLKGVPMPPVITTFLRRLSRERLFSKKPTFRTNFPSRSYTSAADKSPADSEIFSYGHERRADSQYSTHVSDASSSSSSSPAPPPPLPSPPHLDVQKEIQNLSELYSVAADEMEYAVESKGSFYYREDYQTARKAIEECVASYESLLSLLFFESDFEDVNREIGIKVRELQAKFNALPPISEQF